MRDYMDTCRVPYGFHDDLWKTLLPTRKRKVPTGRFHSCPIFCHTISFLIFCSFSFRNNRTTKKAKEGASSDEEDEDDEDVDNF